MLVDFCLPVYNEEKILKSSVLELLDFCRRQNYGFDWRLVIINNGSQDASDSIARELSAQFGEVLAEEVSSPGRGRALKTYWQKSPADILVYMDIDLATSLDHIAELLAPLFANEASLATGSRLLPDSKINRSAVRELSSLAYNRLARLILGHKLSDLQCGFKAIRTTAFKRIAPYLEDDRWFFDTELITFAIFFNEPVVELPVEWRETRYDMRKSKVKVLQDSFKFIRNLIRLKLRLVGLK